MKSSIVLAGVSIGSLLFLGGCMSRATQSVNEHPLKKWEAVQISGGDGNSYENAVVVNGGKDFEDAVTAEYKFISESWGEKDKDWNVVEKTTVTENGKSYDMIQVDIPKVGEKHFYYFDITRCAKKRK
jgi:hypothetical protein